MDREVTADEKCLNLSVISSCSSQEFRFAQAVTLTAPSPSFCFADPRRGIQTEQVSRNRVANERPEGPTHAEQ
jgi:hypothetical protein